MRFTVLRCAYVRPWRNQNQHHHHQYSNQPQQWQQQQQQESPAGITEVASTQNVVLLFGLYYCHDSTKTGGWTFHESKGLYRFSNVFIDTSYRFAMDGTGIYPQGHEWKVIISSYCLRCSLKCVKRVPFHQKYLQYHKRQEFCKSKRYCLRSSRLHPILNPPLFSAEARDARVPSLSGGRSTSPGRRVSGLDGPELATPMLFASATTFKLFVQWNDGLISSSFDLNLVKWDLHNSLATRCSSWSDGGWNQTTYPPDCFRFQDMGLRFSSARALRNKNLGLRFKDFWLYPSMLVLPTLNFEKLGSRADHVNSDQFSNENHVKTWWDFLLVWSINIFQGKCSKDQIFDNETWLWSVGVWKISLGWGLLP